MAGFRSRVRVFVAFVVVLLVPVLAASASTPRLTGITSDAAGNLLEGVQILVLPDRLGADPAGAAWTSESGRYTVSDLEPGVYRVAAVKPGYLTWLGRVNTVLRDTLDIVLRPNSVPGDDEPPLPSEAAWTLRLPERSILREVGEDALLDAARDGARGGTGAAPSLFQDVVEGRFEQSFDVAGGPVTGSDSSLGVQGSETLVSVSAPLNERARMIVSGSRDRFRAHPSDDSVAASRDSAAFAWGLAYDLGLDDHLAVNAFYDSASLETPGLASSSQMSAQAQRTWGYDATWTRQIDPASRVNLRMDYRDTSMELPGAMIDRLSVASPGPADEAANRMIGAATSYESVAVERHRVTVGLRAQRLETPTDLARTAERAALLGLAAQAGWTLGVDAEDAWSVSAPVTVLYGLAYHENLGIPDSGLVVPRLGASWARRGLSLRAMVSYYTSAQSPGELPDHVGRIASESVLGYDVSVEAPLPAGILVRGSRTYRPVHYGNPTAWDVAPEISGRPVFVTDGNAQTTRDGVMIERSFGASRSWIEVARGRAEGTVASVPVFDVPVHLLSDRSLRYVTGRLGVNLARSGTELLASYQQIDEAAAVATALEPTSQEYVELRVAQRIPWIRGATSWKVLLAARTSTIESPADSTREAEEPLDLFSRRVSAGVSVAF